MKQIIRHTAMALILANGETTNLHIKNTIHSFMEECKLTQAEVSSIMNELFQQGLFLRTEHSSGRYFVYTIAPVTAVDTSGSLTQTKATPDLSSNFVTAVNADKDAEKNKMKGMIKTAVSVDLKTNQGVIGNLKTQTRSFLENLDGNLIVAYSANSHVSPILTNVKDKYVARKAFKQITKEKHNNVRMCTLKTWLKNN